MERKEGIRVKHSTRKGEQGNEILPLCGIVWRFHAILDGFAPNNRNFFEGCNYFELREWMKNVTFLFYHCKLRGVFSDPALARIDI